MPPLELSLKKIAQIGEQKEEENIDFRIFLKGQEFDYVDEIVHRLNDEITAQIDCQQCGNCCKSLMPSVTEGEIETLAVIDNLASADFREKFIETDSFEENVYLKKTPCKYLKDKSCTIYPQRPETCRSYPHTHKPEFITRLLFMIDNYCVCPIVFNLMEQLKGELDYENSGDMMFY